MVKTQVYFEEADLEALHRVARRSRRSVAELIREAVKATWLRSSATEGLPGPVAIWSGSTTVPASEHDTIHDDP